MWHIRSMWHSTRRKILENLFQFGIHFSKLKIALEENYLRSVGLSCVIAGHWSLTSKTSLARQKFLFQFCTRWGCWNSQHPSYRFHCRIHHRNFDLVWSEFWFEVNFGMSWLLVWRKFRYEVTSGIKWFLVWSDIKNNVNLVWSDIKNNVNLAWSVLVPIIENPIRSWLVNNILSRING